MESYLKSKSKIKFTKQKYYESQNLSLDSTKSRKYLNWKTFLKPTEALKPAFDWYQSYYKIKNKKKLIDLTFSQIKNYKKIYKIKYMENKII